MVLALVNITSSIHIYHSRLGAGFAMLEHKFVFTQGPWPFVDVEGHSHICHIACL
jgi:hypothetical protein